MKQDDIDTIQNLVDTFNTTGVNNYDPELHKDIIRTYALTRSEANTTAYSYLSAEQRLAFDNALGQELDGNLIVTYDQAISYKEKPKKRGPKPKLSNVVNTELVEGKIAWRKAVEKRTQCKAHFKAKIAEAEIKLKQLRLDRDKWVAQLEAEVKEAKEYYQQFK